MGRQNNPEGPCDCEEHDSPDDRKSESPADDTACRGTQHRHTIGPSRRLASSGDIPQRWPTACVERVNSRCRTEAARPMILE